MKTKFFLFILAVLVLSACQAAPDPAAIAATVAAETAVVASLTPPTATPVPATATASPIPPTNTPTLTNTPTPKPSKTPSPTPTPNATATAQYEGMTSALKEYFDEGYITSTEGKYSRLEDFTDEWAQIGWYQWSPLVSTDAATLLDSFNATDFVLRTDITWESASKSANPSGCGFVFRLGPDNSHYMIFVSLDGYVRSGLTRDRNWKDMGSGYFGVGGQTGSVSLTLIMEDNKYLALVDGKLIKRYTGLAGKMSSGSIAYTIVSGINTDFGTRCKFTNTDVWYIKK